MPRPAADLMLRTTMEERPPRATAHHNRAFALAPRGAPQTLDFFTKVH
jgi:hypothetical protein